MNISTSKKRILTGCGHVVLRITVRAGMRPAPHVVRAYPCGEGTGSRNGQAENDTGCDSFNR